MGAWRDQRQQDARSRPRALRPTATSDPYVDPATGILRNRLGISNADRLAEALAKENHLRGLARSVFIDRLTHYFGEVNAIHPFREGNGRTQRAFFHQLCRVAGWPIDWTGLDPQANTDASVASLRGDNSPLRSVLEVVIASE